MGYLSDGVYVSIHSGVTRLQLEIGKEIEVVFERRFGRRFTNYRFNNLSTMEQEAIITEAGKRVQDRRKGRLVV